MSSSLQLARKILLGVLAPLIATVVIFYLLQPVFGWYLTRIPALGVDLYNSATYVAYHLKNFAISINSFKDIWFGGYPIWRDFPQLHYYLMATFAKFFGLITGIQIYVLTTLFLLTSFSLLLYYNLSKNIVLATVLSLLVAYSVNIYGAATWGGSLPYFASQMFLPLILLSLAKFRKNFDRRWFLAAALISGIGTLGHPLPIVSFAIPAAFFVIFFSLGQETRYGFLARLRDFSLFVVITILVGLRIFYPTLVNSFRGFLRGDIFGIFQVAGGQGGAAQVDLSTTTALFYKSLVYLLYTDTTRLLFYLGAAGILVFLATLVFARRFAKIGQVLPFVLLTIYVAGHVVVNAYGFTFLFQGWYRAFWAFPVVIGALAAVLWGQFFQVLGEKLSQFGKIWLKIPIYVLILILSAGFGVLGLQFYQKDAKSVIEKVEAKSELSSAYPEILSIKFEKSELEKLKRTLVPSFLDPSDKNKRLYTADATVNIWWNSLYEMPLARGYLDPPIGAADRGGFFWLDIAIANDSLVRDFGFSEDIAYNNTLFLIDWYAINYFEGGRLGSKGPSPGPSTYLVKNNVFDKVEEVTTYGGVLKYQTASGKPELHLDLPQTLKFYKVGDNFTSPILAPTTAPAVVIFSNRAGYEDILRMLAAFNINSKKLIPVYGGEYVDELKSSDLEAFDGVILAQYKYRNSKKTFETLEKYVAAGGKIFIDTGSEVKESEADNLPEIFPIKTSVRRGFGKSWELEVSQHKITENIDFSQFGPLIFAEDEWKLSTTPNDVGLREGSNVILAHKGKPILVERKLGEGSVFWSGLNLAYHYNQYKSGEEAKVFKNIVSQFTNLSENQVLPSKNEWVKPEKVRISANEKPRGVLFKEQGYPGWKAKLLAPKRENLPIYLTGPTFPGFIYVPLGNLSDLSFTLEFKYGGERTAYIVFGVSVMTVIILLERILLGGRLFGQRISFATEKIQKRIKSWWEREEE